MPYGFGGVVCGPSDPTATPLLPRSRRKSAAAFLASRRRHDPRDRNHASVSSPRVPFPLTPPPPARRVLVRPVDDGVNYG